MDDTGNLDRVAAHIANGALWTIAENCSAISRLIVHKSVKDVLLDKIEAGMSEWPMDNPLDLTTRRGTLIRKAHFDKFFGYLSGEPNARMSGSTKDGAFVEATVVELPSDDHRLAREIFAPVLSVIEVSSFDEAISVAKDTDYGLCASIFTANGKRALRGARAR